MQTAKQTKLHKALSAFTACALALLMVPIVPGSTQVAVAADTDWVIAETDGAFAKTLLFD